MNTKRNINIVTILVLALMAVCSSPRPAIQALIFTALMGVVFGRDFVLRKRGVLK